LSLIISAAIRIKIVFLIFEGTTFTALLSNRSELTPDSRMNGRFPGGEFLKKLFENIAPIQKV
jgi:hypothetical protein